MYRAAICYGMTAMMINGAPQQRQVVKGPIINLLLKRPELTHEAQQEPGKSAAGAPTVTLQYEPLEKVVVHYPYNKPYIPSSDLIAPSLNKSNYVIKNDTSANVTTTSPVNVERAGNQTQT